MHAATGEHYRIPFFLLVGAVHAAAAAAARARRVRRILKPPVHVGSAGFVPPDDHRVAECARIRAQASRDPSSSSSAAQSLGFRRDCQIFEFMTATFVRKSQKHLCVQGLFILVRRPCGSIMSIGFTPTIGSANHLLQYAKEHKDATPMHEVMKLLKKNNSPLQPTTADIVFSICDDTDNWGLLTKYSKRFVKNGVNLHKAAFDIWMEFATKVGDIESLWKTEKLKCESMKQHTVGSGFSRAKGYLLEGKPEEAATVIHVLNQSLPDAKRSGIRVELQKLVSEWLFEVIKWKKEDDRKALAASLKSDIPAMVSSLLNTGLEVKVNREQPTTECTLC